VAGPEEPVIFLSSESVGLRWLFSKATAWVYLGVKIRTFKL